MNIIYSSQPRTGPAGHREIPGGPVAIKKYYINKLLFFYENARLYGSVRLNFPGRFDKFGNELRQFHAARRPNCSTVQL